MIIKLDLPEYSKALEIINDAAKAYKGVIPEECWKEPYFTPEELIEEVDRGVDFYGYIENGSLVGVMGIQPIKDITLIRHAYVLTSCQRKGIGEKLLTYLLNLAKTSEILVGTWTATWWAIRFYERHGFKIVPRESRSKFREYWTIPDRQAETSVVLKLKKVDFVVRL